MKTDSNQLEWILGGALVLIGLFIIISLVLTRSQAVDTSVNISNVAPSVDVLQICASGSHPCTDVPTLTLTAGASTSFVITGRISDANGYGDITDIDVDFFHTSSGSGCTADDQNCYHFSYPGLGCTIDDNSGYSLDFTCPIIIPYYANSTTGAKAAFPSTTWTVKATATDTGALTDDLMYDTYHIASLLAISTPATIDYGTLSNGAASTTGVTFTITNTGNVDADLETSGTAMTCTFGSIPAANQRYDITNASYATMGSSGTFANLSTSPTSYTNIVLPSRTTASASTDDIYWTITIPSTGASGSCSGTNTITAI